MLVFIVLNDKKNCQIYGEINLWTRVNAKTKKRRRKKKKCKRGKNRCEKKAIGYAGVRNACRHNASAVEEKEKTRKVVLVSYFELRFRVAPTYD
jgi:hypothetical protein